MIDIDKVQRGAVVAILHNKTCNVLEQMRDGWLVKDNAVIGHSGGGELVKPVVMLGSFFEIIT